VSATNLAATGATRWRRFVANLAIGVFSVVRPPRAGAPVGANLDLLGGAVGLDAVDRAALQFLLAQQSDSELAAFMHGVGHIASGAARDLVATLVAERHPKQATVERSIKARGRRIYVDFMQNGLGKTLASAYSARASEFAGVSTPLTWDEIEAGVSPRDFTIASFDQRMKEAGDPWAGLRKAKGADLRALRK
jgi:hypothetical protein